MMGFIFVREEPGFINRNTIVYRICMHIEAEKFRDDEKEDVLGKNSNIQKKH